MAKSFPILGTARLALFLAVPVAGFGQGSSLYINPTSINFGGEGVGITSQTQFIYLENTGSTSITFSSFQTSPEFAVSYNYCPLAPQSLPAFEACSLYVTFTPAAVGLRTGSLTITDDAQGSPQVVSLQGYGTNPAGAISFQPSALIFGTQAVGTASNLAYAYVTNNGTIAVTISSFGATGDYSIIYNSCTAPVVLQPGFGDCFLEVEFTPSAPGPRNGGITVTSDDPTSPDTLPAFGVGVTASSSFIVNPTAVEFPPTGVGSVSGGTGVTITNTGSESITLYHENVSPNFVVSYNPCPESLAVGLSCTLTLQFAPLRSGPLTGSLQVTTSAGTKPVTLSGTGTAPVALLEVTPLGIDFGAVPVSGTSSGYAVQINNSGNVSLTLSSVTLTGDFILQSNQCPTAPNSLAPSATCFIYVAFSPRQSGLRQGSLTISVPANQITQKVQLQGTGGTSLEELTISPTIVNFGLVSLGTVSPTQSVVIQNNTASNLPISQLSATQSYSFTYLNCQPLPVIPPGSNCTLLVNFAPKAPKSIPGALTIGYAGTGSPRTVQLTGTGVATTQQLTFSQAGLVFPTEPLGSPSPIQTVVIENTGTGTVDISTVTFTGDFSNAFDYSDCGSTILLPNSFCNVEVVFSPSAIGLRSGTMVVTSNAAGSPFTVTLTGTGIKPTYDLALVPSSLTFAPEVVGLTSNALMVTAVNYGDEVITFSPPPTTTGDFALSEYYYYCPSIYPGQTCTFPITFTPTATGTRTGTLTLNDNSGTGHQVVKLNGTGYN
jgi:hypothetical protein